MGACFVTWKTRNTNSTFSLRATARHVSSRPSLPFPLFPHTCCPLFPPLPLLSFIPPLSLLLLLLPLLFRAPPQLPSSTLPPQLPSSPQPLSLSYPIQALSHLVRLPHIILSPVHPTPLLFIIPLPPITIPPFLLFLSLSTLFFSACVSRDPVWFSLNCLQLMFLEIRIGHCENPTFGPRGLVSN